MHKLRLDTFHRVYELSRTDWDADEETALHKHIGIRAKEADETYPNNRLVIHFMQPHYPFIGDLGGRISHLGFGNEIHRDGDPRARYTVWGKLQYNLDGLTETGGWARVDEVG